MEWELGFDQGGRGRALSAPVKKSTRLRSKVFSLEKTHSPWPGLHAKKLGVVVVVVVERHFSVPLLAKP